MRFGKQTVEINLTDVKAGRFLENAERYILDIVVNMVRNNQIDTDRRILEIKVRRITPNRYGNDVMRMIKLKAYIKLLLKITMIYSMINKMENTESIELTLRLFVKYDEMYNMQSNILNELSMTCMLVNKGDLNKIYIVSMR